MAGTAIVQIPQQEKTVAVTICRVRAAVLVPASLERLLVLDQMRVPETSLEKIVVQEQGHVLCHVPVHAASRASRTVAVQWSELMMRDRGMRIASDVSKFMAQLEIERMMDEGPSSLNLLPNKSGAAPLGCPRSGQSDARPGCRAPPRCWEARASPGG